jgi:indole-3-glycerol phosphate synthase
MVQILRDIVLNKKLEVEKAKRHHPFSVLREMISELPLARPFSRGLKERETVQVVAEIKKASPSAGIIREDFVPVKIAENYEEAGAGAISILTDEKFFQGSLSLLTDVHQAVSLPCLRKDFIIDTYQMPEARAGGADIILLIMAILSREQAIELNAAAVEFGLEILMEVHTFAELEVVLEENFSFIGINNRDLSTFEVDISTTDKLLEIIPKSTAVVSESGLKTRADIEHVGKRGVDAVLIGESLMKQRDVGQALAEFVKVEKCLR